MNQTEPVRGRVENALNVPRDKIPGRLAESTNPLNVNFPHELDTLFQQELGAWEKAGRSIQLRKGHSDLWTGKDEGKWLGWMTIVERQRARIPELEAFGKLVRERPFSQVVILGMGGSSLCPEVLAKTFTPAAGYPSLRILDSTNPDQIQALEKDLDLERTLFVVSSKSGTTLEPNIFCDYFYAKLRDRVGDARAASCFVAITDPGSELEKQAKKSAFLRVFYGDPSIGGRYSALSDFGMVSAACLGLDLGKLLGSAEAMVQACQGTVKNPGAVLGVALGVLAQAGRNKITFMASPEISDIAAWLEQLLAESTGKDGKGLIPVASEEVGSPEVYGDDRQFHYLRLKSGSNAELDQKADALIKAGQPVVRIDLEGALSLGQEFFRWEYATAVAGAILGINPFDQPDVEAAKVVAKKLMVDYEATGELPKDEPSFTDGELSFFSHALGDSGSQILRKHLSRLNPGDYFAILAFIDMEPNTAAALERLRIRIRDQEKVATCVGFGPRFLHSTGQAYKGGPNTGVFLQLTSPAKRDLPVPGHRYSFGTVQAAQARGDLDVMATRGRRVLRVDLGQDVIASLERLVKYL